MMERKRIVILVDNGGRDLLSCRLLQEGFRKKGALAYLCSRREIKTVFRKIQPHACIAPRGDLPYVRDIAKCCNMYVVPCEGGRLTLRTMMSVFVGRVHTRGDVLSKNAVRLDHHGREIRDFDFIKKVYLWGPQTYDFLLESGYFRPEQLMIAGSVKLDIYRGKRRDTSFERDDFVLGVAFSARATSAFHGKMEYAKLLYDFDEKSHLPVVPPGRHWEDYAWRDFAILRRMMVLIKRFQKETTGKIHLRVGPLEDPNSYKFLEKLHPGRLIIQSDKGELYEFLNSINVLLTCWSTLGLEALLLGVPVIAIPFLIDYNHLISHVDPEANGFNTYLKCYHLPRSEEEVMALIQKAQSGELPITPNQKDLDDVLKNIYNWPSERSCTDIIVDDILNDTLDFKRKSKDVWIKNIPLPAAIEPLVRISPSLIQNFIFWILSKVSNCRHFFKDLISGSRRGSKRHYMTYNPHVEKMLKRQLTITKF